MGDRERPEVATGVPGTVELPRLLAVTACVAACDDDTCDDDDAERDRERCVGDRNGLSLSLSGCACACTPACIGDLSLIHI